MTPEELTRALLAMPPRSAQVLGHRFLEGLTREACAELYGVTPEAWDVLLYRAVRDYEGQRGPQPFAVEQEQAAALRQRLTSTEDGVSASSAIGAPHRGEKEDGVSASSAIGAPHRGEKEDGVSASSAVGAAHRGGKADAHPLLELVTHRDEVRRLLDQAEQLAEASPARKRETVLRWVAIATIAVLSAYFYWQQQEREKNVRHAPYLTVPAQDSGTTP